MLSSALPEWAPNLHPLLVHFPIAWLIAAVIVDIIALLLSRIAWLGATAAALYVAGALSAIATYLTGRQAAASVLIPGAAQAVMIEHWNWALATTIVFSAIAAIRLLMARRPSARLGIRAAVIVAGLGGLLLLVQTGERGAHLVFGHGVGVAPSPANK